MKRTNTPTSAFAIATPRRAAVIVRELMTATGRHDIWLPKEVMTQIEAAGPRIKRKGGSSKKTASDQIRSRARAPSPGANGTGKTLAANMLGKASAGRVVRIDMSAIVSKYIGETEKNLARLFEAARNKGLAVLFFDEADALFGRRSSVKDAHDRYANMEVSYLLQRVEDYDGLAILGSNSRANIDAAAIPRSYDAIIRFPFSTAVARTVLKMPR